MITREIASELLECAKEYPSVSIFGPRQAGKTTLARMTFPDYAYFSLEDPDVRLQAEEDPRGLLSRYPDGLIIDEIQRVPALLSYLQGLIDANPRPGRYILTGSHLPRMREAVTQSLAGRTAVLELYPFSLDEIKQYERPSQSAFEWIVQGFYPRLHESQLRPFRFYQSYVATYLERDVSTLLQLVNQQRFETFLRLLAGRIGQLVNYSSLADDVGVSSSTIKSWISILKASYILFELPPYHANIRKRLVKASKLYFTDVGVAAWLLNIETADQAERDPLRGSLYENLLIMELVKHQLNKGSRLDFYFYRDSNGCEVDLLIPSGSSMTAIEIKSAETFLPDSAKGLFQFSKVIAQDKKLKGYVWYNGERDSEWKGIRVVNPLVHGLGFSLLNEMS